MTNEEKVSRWDNLFSQNKIKLIEISKLTGIATPSLSNYRRGHKMPGALTIDKIESAIQTIMEKRNDNSE